MRSTVRRRMTWRVTEDGGMPLPQQLALGTPQRRRVAKSSFDFAVLRTEVPERSTIHHEVQDQTFSVDPSRCTQPTSTSVMVHIPKLRAEQRTEVPELAAAATVGIQDAATPSQISTMSSNLVPEPSVKCDRGDLHRNVGCIWRVNLENHFQCSRCCQIV